MMAIAFIGLGNMGAGMAGNLLAAGHEVRAYDLDGAAVRALAARGAVATGTLAEALTGVDVIVTMLPAGPQVRSVYAGQDGVFASAAPGSLLIDCSTIDVETARDVAAQAVERGFAMVDAPVSGGVVAAKSGALTFMVGGEADGFARARPVLSEMGKAVIHAGASGAGQAAKICNNMLLAITMIGTCEVFAMAEKLGLDLQTFFDISSRASGQSWSMTSYCPAPGVGPDSPADDDYRPGFSAAMMLKDLKLAKSAASSVGAATPMGALAEALYQSYSLNGNDGKDFSGIINTLRGK